VQSILYSFAIAFELTLADLAVYMINELKMYCKQNVNVLAFGWLFFSSLSFMSCSLHVKSGHMTGTPSFPESRT